MDSQIQSLGFLYKGLQNVIGSLSTGVDDNDGAFNLDLNDLEKRRYEMIVAHKEILDNLPGVTRFSNEDVKNEGIKFLKNDVRMLSAFLEQQNELISDWEALSVSSKGSLKDLEDIWESAKTEYDVTKKDFQAVKRLMHTILQKYYPENQGQLEYILSKLEEKRDDDENPWTEVTEEMDTTAFFILLRSNIVEQHPDKWNLIKFAPFAEKKWLFE